MFGVFESLALIAVTLGGIVAAPLVALAGIEAALVAVGLFVPAVVAVAWAKLVRVDGVAAATARLPELALLRGIPMFAPLPAATLEALVQALRRRTVAAGADIVRQGELGDAFFILASGQADVLVDDRAVRVQGPGEGFGEIALVRDEPRTATVRARTDVELLELPREPFLATVTGHAGSPRGGRERDRSSARLRPAGRRGMTMDWAVLAGLDAHERQRLLELARRRTFARGEVVYHRGDPADSLHLVVNGRFAVRVTTPLGDTAILTVLGPGDAFGEFALPAPDTPRSATVAALESAERRR